MQSGEADLERCPGVYDRLGYLSDDLGRTSAADTGVPVMAAKAIWSSFSILWSSLKLRWHSDSIRLSSVTFDWNLSIVVSSTSPRRPRGDVLSGSSFE